MNSMIRKYVYFLMAGITYIFVHEGVHLIQAQIYGVYEEIRFLPLGIEVVIKEPLTIGGWKLASFSGLSSIVTLLIGYVLFFLSPKILKLNFQPIKNYVYYVIFVFLLLDPIYMSILSFFVGGDINGITFGLGVPYIVVRAVFFVIVVINIYLVYKKLYPAYVIKE